MPFIRLKCTRGNLRFLPQYRARSRLRRKQALRAQSSFGEAGQSAHWIGKLKKSPPRITPKRDWAAMETKHAVLLGVHLLRPRPPRGCFPLRFPLQAPECVNAAFACPTNGTTAKRPASGRRRVGRYAVSFAAAPAAGVLPLWLPPHALECANVVFACPTNGTTAKRPAFVRRGQGAMLRALRPRPPRGCFPLRFPLQAPDCANVIFCLPGAALKGACGPRR